MAHVNLLLHCDGVQGFGGLAVMDRFQTPLVTEVASGTIKDRPWILARHLSYITDEIEGVEEIVVPLGYRSDLASIPRMFWRIFPPGGPYRRAAVVHDFLCTAGQTQYPICNYIEAANVFKEAMINDDVPQWIVKACYSAVLKFGPRF